MARRTEKLSDNEIGQIVRREIDLAVNEDGSTVTELNRKALAYYEGKMQSAPEGRSQVVSYDVADTIHALLANFNDAATQTQISFEPESEEDETDAQLESDVIKSLLKKNDAYKIFYGASFDALLQQNGWMKVSIKTKEMVSHETYEMMTPEQMMQLQSKAVERGESIDVIKTTTITENPLIEETTIKRTKVLKELCIETIPPENIIFSQRTDADDIDDLIMIGERKYLTVSELIDLGIDRKKAEALPSYDSSQSIVGQQRNSKQDLNTNQGDNQTATQLKEVYCVYQQLDMNHNSQTELYYVIIGRDTSDILLKEPANFAPYVTGTAIPMPHRIIGQSIYEVMKGVQEQKTFTLRQFMDNLNVANNSRTGYIEGKVNMEEMLNGRVNGYIGMKRPDALVPLPATDISAQCIAGLNYLDDVRSQRGGAALDMTQGEMQIANSSATAAIGEINAKEKMSQFFLGNLCKTILTGVYKITHRILREEWNGPLNAKVRGKWQQVNPSDWKMRTHLDIQAGMTQTEKRARTNNLQLLLQKQEELMMTGQANVLTDLNKVYNTMTDWLRSADIDNPEEYFIDPTSEESQQVQAQNAESQAQQQQMMQQQQQMMIEMQQQLELMKDATERWKTEQELQFKYFDSMVKNDEKEAELTLSAVQNLNTDKEDEPRAVNE